jgi:hypothetical protein
MFLYFMEIEYIIGKTSKERFLSVDFSYILIYMYENGKKEEF